MSSGRQDESGQGEEAAADDVTRLDGGAADDATRAGGNYDGK